MIANGWFLVPAGHIGTNHGRIISACALERLAIALAHAHQSEMGLSLVITGSAQDSWWPTARQIYIIIVKCILKSQHLIVTDVWRLVKLVSVSMIFAQFKLIRIILFSRFSRILKCRCVSQL